MNKSLTQVEANQLAAMVKIPATNEPVYFPMSGEKLSVDLQSQDGKQAFKLDVNRGRIRLTQVTFQERVRDTFVLVRLDVDGPPHTNPDGTFVPVPHLHEYREGYGDKWAREAVEFTNTNDMWQTLIDFLHFCNVQSGNKIQKQLFQ